MTVNEFVKACLNSPCCNFEVLNANGEMLTLEECGQYTVSLFHISKVLNTITICTEE